MFFVFFCDGEGCKFYIIGCEEICVVVIIDFVFDQVDCYIGEVGKQGLCVCYIIDMYIYVDYFFGVRVLCDYFVVLIVMYCYLFVFYVDLYVEDGYLLLLGVMWMWMLYILGYMCDLMVVYVEDWVFIGDMLLIGGMGCSDLLSGDFD